MGRELASVGGGGGQTQEVRKPEVCPRAQRSRDL